jgi:hypothetical protein
MRKIALAATVLTLLAVAPQAAHADPPDVAGQICNFVTTTDPQNQGNQTGEVHSWFATADEPQLDPTGNPAHGHISCIFKTGAGNGTYASGGTVVTKTSTEQTGLVVLAEQVSYADPGTAPVFICTVWTATDANGDSVTYYADDTTGELIDASTAGAGASTCAEATSQDTSPVDSLICGIFDLLPEPVRTTLRTLWGCP